MSHPQAATEFLKDQAKAKWHDETLWFVRDKRDRISKTIPEWEELRTLASQIKENVLACQKMVSILLRSGYNYLPIL